jgi:hypothetical protein
MRSGGLTHLDEEEKSMGGGRRTVFMGSARGANASVACDFQAALARLPPVLARG